ncbi:MAG TPA: hypothetical protein VJ487_15090 [Alphaproteobacteria bacterium]|nr:hypothetical protein [Alphaproteobacteria bacterium]
MAEAVEKWYVARILADLKGNIISALVLYGVIVLTFGVCVSAISHRARVTAGDEEHDSGNRARSFPIWSLLALAIPILGVFEIGPFTHPSSPWTALLGSSLSYLGLTLAGAAIGVGHFNILRLYSRLSTFAAAIVFFSIGIVLSNLDALAS